MFEQVQLTVYVSCPWTGKTYILVIILECYYKPAHRNIAKHDIPDNRQRSIIYRGIPRISALFRADFCLEAVILSVFSFKTCTLLNTISQLFDCRICLIIKFNQSGSSGIFQFFHKIIPFAHRAFSFSKLRNFYAIAVINF